MSAPLVLYPFFHRAEEVMSEGPTVVWWMLAPPPLLAAVSAARAGGRMWRAVTIGTVVAAAYLGLSWAVYRWGIPVRRTVGAEAFLGLPLAATGALIGYRLGRPGARGGRWPGRVVAGALIAVVGASLVPVTVQRGAEFSFRSFPAGPDEIRVDRPVPLTLVAAGRYGLYAVGSAPTDPDCQVTGAGQPDRAVELLPVKPGTPGVDATPAYRWIGEFQVPAASEYSLTCRGSVAAATYSVNRVPRIRGAVGTLVHWPLPILWLFGALPGLLLIATGLRRAIS
ncbi:hypothetical protein AB0C12_02690 [Actinoplanes sp. NPDC048967]|uniref:hypothetical protein n=1 Tax=Actinoplanes sp. NPDC048967 TaxID=3155269 RepID=UPI0033D589F8